MKLAREHHYVLDRMEQNRGVTLVTGKAGTGKSTLLQLFRKISDRSLIILAPTGVAAVNVRGQTIHSFFRFPAGWFAASEIKPIPKNWAEKLDMIIIDEISMVRADIIDHIDFCLKKSTGSQAPFGGIPMVWLGDPFQLPPVISNPQERNVLKNTYESPYFFSSNAFKNLQNFEMIELHQVFRQEEIFFIRLLNQLRMGELDEDGLQILNERVMPSKNTELRIHLCATNRSAQLINQKNLDALQGKPIAFKAKIDGAVHPSQFPNDGLLVLKPGAQVMFLRNDSEKRWYNGSLGRVHRLSEDTIEVLLDETKQLVHVERSLWEIIKYSMDYNSHNGVPSLKAETVGSFCQFPIKPAWAITIHKSQGKTFDKIHIDLGHGAFEYGQLYVALSRCKTLSGITLEKPLRWHDLYCDERVMDFMRRFS